MRVLLCDPQRMFLDALSEALRSHGDDVTSCSHATDAVDQLETSKPHVCVLAVRSPADLRPVADLRRASPDTPVVLLLTHPSPAAWHLYDGGDVAALTSHEGGISGLRGLLEEVSGGRRQVSGLVRVPARRASAHDLLTDREHQVLRLMADGVSTAQMSVRLGLSAHTVRTHVHNVLHKLGAPRRVLAVRRAEELGLITSRAAGLVG